MQALCIVASILLAAATQGETVTTPMRQLGYGQLLSAALSPDGSKVITGSSDGKARIWNANTGVVERTLETNSGEVTQVGYTQDGKKVLTACFDHWYEPPNESYGWPKGFAKIWDAATGECLLTKHVLEGVDYFVAALSPDGKKLLMTGYPHHIAEICDASTGAIIKTISVTDTYSIPMTAAAFSQDGTMIVTGDSDLTFPEPLYRIKTWNVATGAIMHTMIGSGKVLFVSFSPNGTRILSVSDNGEIKLWNAETGACIRTVSGYAAAFNADGSRYVVGLNTSAKVYDTATGTEIGTFSGHKSNVNIMSTSSNAAKLLTGSYRHVEDDGTAKLWDLATMTEGTNLRGHSSCRVGSVVFSPDGTALLTATGVRQYASDTYAKLWDVQTGQETRTFAGHTQQVKTSVFSPDGTKVLTGSLDTTLKLWNAATGSEIRTYAIGTNSSITSAAFSPDGTKIFAGGSIVDDTKLTFSVKMIDVASGAEEKTFYSAQVGAWSLTLSPDGKLLASSRQYVLNFKYHYDTTVWDVSTTNLLHAFPLMGPGLSFSPDGTKLLIGSEDTVARIFDTDTWEEIQPFVGHSGGITAAAFSPDGGKVVTASLDGTAKLWIAATGEEIRTFSPHAGLNIPLYHVAFSPNGNTIVSADIEVGSELLLWDISNIPGIPAAPSTPGATAITMDSITWTWQHDGNDETGFKVWSDATANEPVTLRTTTAADITGWLQTGLTPNTLYTFQVAAANTLGVSRKTPPFSAWTLAATPGAPVVGAPVGNTLPVSIAEDGNPEGTLYAIQVTRNTKSGDGKAEILWVQADGTLGPNPVYMTAEAWGTISVSTLYDYTTYTFVVLAQNGAGVSAPPSANTQGTTEDGPPWTIISPAAPVPTTADAVTFEVVFSEALASDLTDDDVALAPGSLAGSLSVTGTGQNYVVTVALSDPDADGTVGIALAEGSVSDLTGHEYAGDVSAAYVIHNWPDFAAQPLGGKLYVGDTLSVSIDEAGVPTSYQWKCETQSKALINGPATPSWTLGASAADGVYWCEVTYDGVMHPSADVDVELRPRIVITEAPEGGSVQIGGDFGFSATAVGGYGMLHYQWRKDMEDIDGATDDTYAMTELSFEQTGWYSVHVFDENTDFEDSAPVKLEVTPIVPAIGVCGLLLLGIALAASLATNRRRAA